MEDEADEAFLEMFTISSNNIQKCDSEGFLEELNKKLSRNSYLDIYEIACIAETFIEEQDKEDLYEELFEVYMKKVECFDKEDKLKLENILKRRIKMKSSSMKEEHSKKNINQTSKEDILYEIYDISQRITRIASDCDQREDLIFINEEMLKICRKIEKNKKMKE